MEWGQASALQLPDNQTALVAPTSDPSSLALGVGVQNFTCGSDGTYASSGVLTKLFDITCLYGSDSFSTIQTDAYSFWYNVSLQTSDAVSDLTTLPLFGELYHVVGSDGSLSPEFDFTSTTFDDDAFVVTAPIASIPAPTGSSDIDWQQLNQTSGSLADQVFVVNTVAGQPPSSCDAGSDPISVKYTAQYFFYGGSISSY
ncbi:hypothetical protein FA95DRAFT_1162258 [Auriscalpium vulgare]|uniref:Uncharacterized protein n=1 Tax=Auriscalpium vulgare TaxID=40419 RepID=A0ACB8SA66_9AGAM|nr:hypothetical protein FA95DRAFT_1162258 [Auriscalpium vulgare]